MHACVCEAASWRNQYLPLHTHISRKQVSETEGKKEKQMKQTVIYINVCVCVCIPCTSPSQLSHLISRTGGVEEVEVTHTLTN